LARALGGLCEGSMGVGFFAQDRPVYDDAAVAGFAVVLPLRDRAGDGAPPRRPRAPRAVRRRDGVRISCANAWTASKSAGSSFPTRRSATRAPFGSDPAPARHLVVTNWSTRPSRNSPDDRLNKVVEKSAADSVSLRNGLGEAPDDLRGGVVFEGKCDRSCFDQKRRRVGVSADIVVRRETSPSGAVSAWRTRRRAGLVPGSPEYGALSSRIAHRRPAPKAKSACGGRRCARVSTRGWATSEG
jgi:hypothetical protein